MQTVLADLHVHTLLSPCAEVEMTPHHIVMRDAEYGIGAVAITDHNASANVPAALEAAQRYGVKVFPGMEVESSEEAHIVALFDTLEQLQSWQLLVDEHMNGMLNDVERFGAQYVVDAEDEFVREEQRLLHAVADSGAGCAAGCSFGRPYHCRSHRPSFLQYFGTARFY